MQIFLMFSCRMFETAALNCSISYLSGCGSDSRRHGLLQREREEIDKWKFANHPDDLGHVGHVAGCDFDRRNVARSHRVVHDVLKSGQFY